MCLGFLYAAMCEQHDPVLFVAQAVKGKLIASIFAIISSYRYENPASRQELAENLPGTAKVMQLIFDCILAGLGVR
jgi:hypothetical protein